MGRKARPATPAGVEDHIDEGSLGYLVRDTHKHFARLLQTRLECEGIGLSQWYFLRVLWDGDGLTQAELGNRAGTMSPTTVAVLNGLEAQGLVERRRHPTDRRKFNIYLTKRGRQLKRVLLPKALGVNAVAVESIPVADLEHAFDVLKRVRANLIHALSTPGDAAEAPTADGGVGDGGMADGGAVKIATD